MPRTTQLVLTLRSRPGVLADIARALAEAGVNITALCAGDAAGRGKIRILVNNAVKARRALRAAGYRPVEEPAFVVRMRNRSGHAGSRREQGRRGPAQHQIRVRDDGGRLGQRRPDPEQPRRKPAGCCASVRRAASGHRVEGCGRGSRDHALGGRPNRLRLGSTSRAASRLKAAGTGLADPRPHPSTRWSRPRARLATARRRGGPLGARVETVRRRGGPSARHRHDRSMA